MYFISAGTTVWGKEYAFSIFRVVEEFTYERVRRIYSSEALYTP
jgi:hypothetical protein